MDLTSTAQLLGNLGEFIGGVAVLVTIIYLAIQVRHGAEELRANTAQSKTAALRESYGQYQQWTEVFFSDPTFMETWIHGLGDSTVLAQSDLMKFRTALANHIWLLSSIRQASVASGELTTWESTLKGAATLFATPGFRTWWDLAKAHFPRDFVTDVDGADFTLLPSADYSGRVPDEMVGRS